MNIKYITYLISGLFLFFLFPSCNSDDTTTSYSSQSKDAQIYSFSLSAGHYHFSDSIERATDSIRFIQVNKTRFAIDQINGIIYNPDSLPFGTVLRNKVVVTATYYSGGYSGVKVITPDSINGYAWNNTDSIDFSKTPITFTVTSLEGATSKSYNIDIRIHKVDPDTLTWTQMPSCPSTSGSSKTLLIDNETFYTYSINSGSVSLDTSNKSNMSWESQPVTGLPATVNTESISHMNDVFYAVLENGDSYKSNDGQSWAQVVNDKVVTSILGILPAANRADDVLLLIINESGQYYFGKTKDMSSIEIVSHISISPANNIVPADFPIQQAASFTNYSTDKNSRMLIITGGLNAIGSDVSYTWFIQNSTDGIEITPSIQNNLFKGTGISNFIYDNKLYALVENQFYISEKWGTSWYLAPNKQILDPAISARTGQTLIVDNENYIWILGGVSEKGSYLNDVWKGRLNKLVP